MSKKKRLLIKILAVVVAVVALAGVREYLLVKDEEAEASSGVDFAVMVKENHPLLVEFRSRYPERNVLLACAEDITNDEVQDLVVISQLDDEISTIVLYTNDVGALVETLPIPAPRENQHIRFFNMDKVAEMETLITGEKDGQVGYAIYRIMDGEMINLFGEGMEDCC